MTITFFEYGNSITFNTHDMPHDLALWEEGISAGDVAVYHDRIHGTRPHGKVISVSPSREFLLVRLAGYEKFVIVRKIKHDEYIVVRSDIAEALKETGKLYYEGAVLLQNIYWERDAEGAMHILFVWFHNGEHRMFADVVTLSGTENGSELIDFISGRYTTAG